jgi:hypothetical protein
LQANCADQANSKQKTPQSGVFLDPSGLHRMNKITWQQMRQQLEQQQERMRQQQEPKRQQLGQQQLELERVQEQQLLFCRKRTKQQQRR